MKDALICSCDASEGHKSCDYAHRADLKHSLLVRLRFEQARASKDLPRDLLAIHDATHLASAPLKPISATNCEVIDTGNCAVGTSNFKKKLAHFDALGKRK